ncbi:hypothetical protein OHC33_002341 [Knufia fluminis]|uniref:Uncharacterized protein n=1 Tax=Knufia fluminis TaxID=191047 RepID=A0AAN8I6I3_9EURO|nr:hypothetical protein OHC33_002341 [Knufia fluminis]
MLSKTVDQSPHGSKTIESSERRGGEDVDVARTLSRLGLPPSDIGTKTLRLYLSNRPATKHTTDISEVPYLPNFVEVMEGEVEYVADDVQPEGVEQLHPETEDDEPTLPTPPDPVAESDLADPDDERLLELFDYNKRDSGFVALQICSDDLRGVKPYWRAYSRVPGFEIGTYGDSRTPDDQGSPPTEETEGDSAEEAFSFDDEPTQPDPIGTTDLARLFDYNENDPALKLLRNYVARPPRSNVRGDGPLPPASIPPCLRCLRFRMRCHRQPGSTECRECTLGGHRAKCSSDLRGATPYASRAYLYKLEGASRTLDDTVDVVDVADDEILEDETASEGYARAYGMSHSARPSAIYISDDDDPNTFNDTNDLSAWFKTSDRNPAQTTSEAEEDIGILTLRKYIANPPVKYKDPPPGTEVAKTPCRGCMVQRVACELLANDKEKCKRCDNGKGGSGTNCKRDLKGLKPYPPRNMNLQNPPYRGSLEGYDV